MDGIQTTNANGDALIRAVAYDGTVRILALTGRQLVEKARVVHALSRTATAALGRQLLMTAILSADLKNATDRVSTILKGGGPGGTMICTGDPMLSVKGTVGDAGVELPPTEAGKLDVSGYVGNSGYLTVVRDLSMKEPYVGNCPLVSGEIAEDFAQYYAVSEQQPSIVYLGVRVHPATGRVRAAGGLLIQPLPGCPEETVDALQALAPKAAALAKRLDEGTLLPAFLAELFEGASLSLLDERLPRYRCDCSRRRVERALISTGAAELRDMIEQDGGAEVQCHFCNKTYRFTAEQLTALLARATKGTPLDKR